MSKKGLIIYDFDGVIVNSRESVIIFYRALFNDFNQKAPDWLDPEISADVFSLSHVQMLKKFIPGIDSELLEKMKVHVPDVEDEIVASLKLEEGVSEIIPILSTEYNLAICTNRGESVNRYLERFSLEKYFSYIITSLDVKEPKPHPEGVYKILNYFKTNNALYIGDSETDYHAAKGAGVDFLAFNADLFGSNKIRKHHEVLSYLK